MALRICYQFKTKIGKIVREDRVCVPIPVRDPRRPPEYPDWKPQPDPWIIAEVLKSELLDDLVALSTIVAASNELSPKLRTPIKEAVSRARDGLSIPEGFSIEGLKK